MSLTRNIFCHFSKAECKGSRKKSFETKGVNDSFIRPHFARPRKVNKNFVLKTIARSLPHSKKNFRAIKFWWQSIQTSESTLMQIVLLNGMLKANDWFCAFVTVTLKRLPSFLMFQSFNYKATKLIKLK